MTTRPGLRERKRLATMKRLQEVALDLFDERGFTDVTIEEIADAADVSPSSVYRYFGSKEQLVVYDDFDIQFMESVDAELTELPTVAAMRAALAETMTQVYDHEEEELARRKTRYALEEPALRPALMKVNDDIVRQLAGRLVRSSNFDELEAEVTAGALMGAMMAATRHWHRTGYKNSIREELERALDVLERGL